MARWTKRKRLRQEPPHPWDSAISAFEKIVRRDFPEARVSWFDDAGQYELDVEYFDQNNGESQFRLLVNGRQLDSWTANDHLPSKVANGDTSVRRRSPAVTLRAGDHVRIEGVPDAQERAPFDYVEVIRLPAATRHEVN